MRAHTVCTVPGCPNLAVKAGRCAGCYGQQRAQSEVGRPTSRQRGYDATWEKVRKDHLKQFPVCAVCGAAAMDVHHVVALRRGGTHHEGNLLSLCHAHHSEVTARTRGWGKG